VDRQALVVLLVAVLAGSLAGAVLGQAPRAMHRDDAERMIITGVPPFGPTQWTNDSGKTVPAGCGPEAARMLLAYYDRRYGYTRLVRDAPGQAIRELRERMNTLTVMWQGRAQGFTDPGLFIAGLKSYVEARYPGGLTLGSRIGTLAQVFEKSVELIRSFKPHVILFDWEGAAWIFPNHYAVVVGFSIENGRSELIINTGWGYDFQILDMTDTKAAPSSIVWIEEIADPPDGQAGVALGPGSAQGMWTVDQNGRPRLEPVLHRHFDPNETVSWSMSDRVQFFLSQTPSKIGVASWD
jgi:hypothetical protein